MEKILVSRFAAYFIKSLFCIFLLLISAGKIHAQYYEQTIYLFPEATKEVQAAAEDMACWMEHSTGKKFKIIKGNRGALYGISIQNTKASSLTPTLKKDLEKNRQAFYLEISSASSATVTGSTEDAMINGIYTFLHELGFRWYMPGDAWVIVPNIKGFKKSINKLYIPDFQNRNYFGTGGIAAIAGIDPKNNFKQDFDLWNRRNRFTSDNVMKGHTGQAFYKSNQKVLSEHPEYFCNGKVNTAGRIDINNSGAVKLFTEWAIGQVSGKDDFPVIGVDPADGSGGQDDCLPSGMPQIKTWSDKYFWLANKVAEKAETQNLNAWVQLYAYASHAEPPHFDIHSGIYTVIVPYAFQRVTDPEEFIRLWQKKLNGRPMGLYDYWNITQWSSDVPQFNIYSIPEKLRTWKKANVTSVRLESTNAKGPMGHAMWLATQMMWNTEQDFDSLYNAFLSDCFDEAAPDIKRMYDRWSLHYQYGMEVALSSNDLALAASKTKNKAVLKRIGELKAYVHYLKLFYDYKAQPTLSNYNELINYIYGIHHLRLLQTYALQARYIKAPNGSTKRNKDKAILKAENKNVTELGFEVIEKNFKIDLKEAKSAYKISDFTFDITNASNNKVNVKNKIYQPLYINGKNRYIFYLTEPRSFTLKAGATLDTRIKVEDEKGKIWIENTVKGSKDEYETFSTKLPKGKYYLTFGALYRFSRFIFPEEVPYFSSHINYDNYKYPLQYAYVPKDVDEIIYRDARGPGVNNRGNWIDPDGKLIQPQILKYDIYRIPIPPQHKGKVWVLNIGHGDYELLNFPNMFSLKPFEYLE